MPEPLRHPLRLQIASRLALALLVTIATTVALGFWFHWHANQRSLEHHLQQATTHFNAALALRETEWERAAYNFKARLEYSRVLEDASGRQGKLGSFITAQGGVPEFPVVVVLDHEGNRLAWFAYLGEYIPSVASTPEKAAGLTTQEKIASTGCIDSRSGWGTGTTACC